jgi:hypothetical protein
MAGIVCGYRISRKHNLYRPHHQHRHENRKRHNGTHQQIK